MERKLETIKLKFEPRDLWIGIYWDFQKWAREPQSDLRIYICFIPMFPLYIHIHSIDLDWYKTPL